MVTKLGGTVDDSELVNGMVFDHKAAKTAGGPTRVENAKVALIQFCISPPKTDLENNVIISDYAQMDRCAVWSLPRHNKYFSQPPGLSMLMLSVSLTSIKGFNLRGGNPFSLNL